MSFGFLPRSSGLHVLAKQIHQATTAGVTVFAAASNDGGNADRTFPASRNDVICIHSCDGNGKESSFNPKAQRNRDNFLVVGEHIAGAWPKQPDGESRNDGFEIKTGTSFATPI